MAWWRTLLGLPSAAVFERATVVAPEPSTKFSIDLTPVDDLIKASASLSGARISRKAALSVPAVLRGRNLLCSIATLPLITRDANRNVVRSPLLEQIDPNVPNPVVLAQTVEDLAFDAISWWRVTERNAAGWPVHAMHCDRDTVSLEPPGDKWREARTLPSGQQLPGGSVWVNGVEIPGRDMIRFDSLNPPLCEAAARTIRRALLIEQVAALYASDPRPQDYFTPAEGADPADDDEIREILDTWRAARRERSTAYVPSSLKYNSVDSPSPADLQLAELEKQVTVGLANAMGVDPEDLGVSTTTRTYQNGVDRRQDRVNDTLSEYMVAITARLSMNDVTRRGQKADFDLDAYLRADPATRWQTYEIGLRTGVISIEEVRAEEGLPAVPVEPSARNRVRNQTPQEVAGMPGARTEATAPVAVQFSDEEASAVVSFALSTAEAQFAVDRETRTVSGLLVPWNKIARSGWSKWSFRPNSLTWADPSRVKLNREHDRRTAVAYASELKNTTAGLWGSFKVARGAAGDEVLSLAEDKVLDGFSIEVDFDGDGSEWTRDPDDELVKVVVSGQLKGCAITSAPAFDDARVERVAATRNERNTGMSGSTGTEQETPAAAPALTPEVMTAFTAAVVAFTANIGNQTEALNALVEAQQNGGDGPANVDPTRGIAQFTVNEEPMYRFDGSRGKHDFSSDVIAGLKDGDGEALKRATDWITENFGRARAQFAVTTSNVASLNPNIQRPDLYVDQLQYPTPIWDAIRKGTLDDSTPFVLPKFNASSGLVGDHTQGTEPTPGALTTTSQTITPTAVSGKVEITREAWDQGGNPQLSTIVWRQMVRAYDEALEQAAAALLAGLTVTTLTLTDGAVNKALAAEVKSALAGLHFVRGGFRFRDFVLENGLYTSLSEAVDDTGRPLFPVIGATNADGQAGTLFGSLNIAGLAGRPAWALPYTAGAENASFLFNREDVHGWATTPRRLDFEYRVAMVDIGIWGYKALACTRTDGVRKFAYDETA